MPFSDVPRGTQTFWDFLGRKSWGYWDCFGAVPAAQSAPGAPGAPARNPNRGTQNGIYSQPAHDVFLLSLLRDIAQNKGGGEGLRHIYIADTILFSMGFGKRNARRGARARLVLNF